MMPRRSTPTFTVELPLVVTRAHERELLVRLDFARQLYNASLGEALRRLDLMRQSHAWDEARALPRTVKGKSNPERRITFAAARETFGFTSAAISAFGTQCKNEAKWNEGRGRQDARIGAHECQRIAERAFAAAEMHALGVRGRPRFKGNGRPLRSIEGKGERSGLRWDKSAGILRWASVVLTAKMPPNKNGGAGDQWLMQAIDARTKYARLIWRMVKGRRRWFVQLMQEGVAPLKYQPNDGAAAVGLDVGPSTVAVFSDHAAALVPLAAGVVQPWSELRRIKRALDRSRRATNPQCYNEDGTFRKGGRIIVRSRHYEQLRATLTNTERKLAERRNREHGHLANQILACGTQLQAEDLSYLSFQRSFGRSTKVRAAGSFMRKLRLKAERAGGELRNLNTRALKLSQYDHTSNACTKKPLSQRWHVLADGSGVVQRDIYSAFLAACADGDAVHQRRAEQAWPAAQSLLRRAGWMQDQPVSVAGLLATAPEAFGLPTPERSHGKEHKPRSMLRMV